MKVGVTYSSEEKLIPYCAALRAAALEPVPLHYGASATLDGLSGLVISGGPDVDPARYGEPMDGSENCIPARDAMEMDLLARALDRDMPVLGICRGIQLINVFHGGSLHQRLDNSALHQRVQEFDAHTVTVQEGTRLAGLVGAGEYSINSRHRQAVKQLGGNLVVSARASDGGVEAIERPDKRWTIAVQWHPEDRFERHEQDRLLFEAFARAVSG